MPKIIIDNREVDVPIGTTLMQAAEKLGVAIPYYCWHPGLSIAGNCRMCLVEVEKSPKPVIACNTQAAEGMVVKTGSQMAKKARAGTLEFLLINHPLDCPVCDQAGECELQNFYMQHGLYDARFDEEKIKKKKAVPVGPTVILDSERCILCSRCVRFCDEITHTGELGIVNRGDHEEIAVFPGKELNNKYSGNVVDICPVGALTDRDFRFKCRVWYLEPADSVCPGCANGCNIRIDSNLSRPQHGQGERVMRLKPRENSQVNQWWICDEGRYGYKLIDHDRILQTTGGGIPELADRIEQTEKSKIGVLVSTHLANEDMFAIRKLFWEKLGIENIRAVPAKTGYQDDFLMKRDKSPNTAGAKALDISFEPLRGDLDILISFGVDLENQKSEIRNQKLIFVGSNQNVTSAKAQMVIPSAVYAEKEGTFTNCEGRVQRFWKAFEPLGEARAEWEIVSELANRLDIDLGFKSAKSIFDEIAQTVSSFEGMSYEKLGKSGMLLNTEKFEILNKKF